MEYEELERCFFGQQPIWVIWRTHQAGPETTLRWIQTLMTDAVNVMYKNNDRSDHAQAGDWWEVETERWEKFKGLRDGRYLESDAVKFSIAEITQAFIGSHWELCR